MNKLARLTAFLTDQSPQELWSQITSNDDNDDNDDKDQVFTIISHPDSIAYQDIVMEEVHKQQLIKECVNDVDQDIKEGITVDYTVINEDKPQ